MAQDYKNLCGILYECVRCGYKAPENKWSYTGGPGWKCPQCGYRVARKTRPPIVKRIKAT